MVSEKRKKYGLGVEEVRIDVTGGGGIEGEGIEVDRDGKMRHLLERRGFLGEKNNSEKLKETSREEEEDLGKTFSAVVTCVKAYLRRNEVMKLEVSLAISAWTRSTQAERLEKCSVEGEVKIGEEGTDTNKDYGI